MDDTVTIDDTHTLNGYSAPEPASELNWNYFRGRVAGGLIAAVASFLLLPAIMNVVGGPRWVTIGTAAGIWAIAALGLDVVWGLAGHVSLGQHGFVALGAYVTALATVEWGLGPEAGLFLGVVVAIGVSFVVGAIVLRLEETYMALATLGVGLIIPALFNAWEWAGSAIGLYGVPSFSVAGMTVARDQVYWLVWVTAALVAAALVFLRVSRLGLGWRALAEDDDLAESCGVPTYRAKITALAISAALGSIAGSFYAHYYGAISPASFSAMMLVVLLTAVVVGGLGKVVGIGASAIGLSLVVSRSGDTNELTEFVFGIVLGVVLYVAPKGLAGLVGVLSKRLPVGWLPQPVVPATGGRASRPAVGVAQATPASSPDRPEVDQAPEPVLIASAISKAFGGAQVLDEVTLTIERGQTYGLVGANGAGKSTLLNILCGSLPADDGKVLWRGEDITAWASWRRSRAGIARTFQHPRTVSGMTALENIALGAILRGQPGVHASFRQAYDAAREVADRLGLSHRMLNQDASVLTFSQQRIVEIGRGLMADPVLLCLDEATSGLDVEERLEVRGALKRLAESGLTLCIVEHDPEFIADICERVTVLDNGRVIAEAAGDAVFHDRSVVSSYTGA